MNYNISNQLQGSSRKYSMVKVPRLNRIDSASFILFKVLKTEVNLTCLFPVMIFPLHFLIHIFIYRGIKIVLSFVQDYLNK